MLLTVFSWGQVRASVYAKKFEGRRTYSGQIFHESKLTAASRTLPLGTRVRLIDLRTHKSIVVLINDRGPWVPKFSLDLTLAAAKQLGFGYGRGWDWVKIEVIKKEKHANKQRIQHRAHHRRGVQDKAKVSP